IFTNYYDNNRNLHTNTYNPRFPNQPITLYWYQHESSNVTSYRIRRGANINGTTTWSTIATVSGGTTSYTDNDFLIAASKSTGSIVMYDVKAYYSPDQTESVNEAITVYGNTSVVEKTANTDSTSTELPAINEYALNSNYPNPFNPTTQISYQLPENSFVNLVVYNSLGQKVAELVNQNQSSGKYTVKFNAANLPSGVYIYKLQTDNFSDVKKMLLTK
ncbi:MAG: T9SS type A sorting domain-containing protein, partial [Bacteroidetes bacterium]|nr:T9SS type A sorting domain-containing protein [Bacteroidota bacterium]